MLTIRVGSVYSKKGPGKKLIWDAIQKRKRKKKRFFGLVGEEDLQPRMTLFLLVKNATPCETFFFFFVEKGDWRPWAKGSSILGWLRHFKTFYRSRDWKEKKKKNRR